jgi:hypothetical protein
MWFRVALALFAADSGVLFEAVFDCAQRIDRIDTGDAVANQRTRETIDDVTRRDAVHAFAHRLFFQLAHVFDL